MDTVFVRPGGKAPVYQPRMRINAADPFLLEELWSDVEEAGAFCGRGRVQLSPFAIIP